MASRFDERAKALARGVTRRQALRGALVGIVGGVAAAMLLVSARSAAVEASAPVTVPLRQSSPSPMPATPTASSQQPGPTPTKPPAVINSAPAINPKPAASQARTRSRPNRDNQPQVTQWWRDSNPADAGRLIKPGLQRPLPGQIQPRRVDPSGGRRP